MNPETTATPTLCNNVRYGAVIGAGSIQMMFGRYAGHVYSRFIGNEMSLQKQLLVEIASMTLFNHVAGKWALLSSVYTFHNLRSTEPYNEKIDSSYLTLMLYHAAPVMLTAAVCGAIFPGENARVDAATSQALNALGLVLINSVAGALSYALGSHVVAKATS